MTTNHNRAVRDSRAATNIASLPADYRLPFAACYVYSPKGESEVSQRSRQLCARVKSGSTKWLRSYAATVHQEVVHGRRFLEFFNDHTLLVPIPEYRPSSHMSFWTARRFALALQQTGLAEEVWTGLRRVCSVEKSSSAWMWERPTVQQHYQSFAVIPSSKQARKIVLVDDVITKGRTLAAAAMRLQDAFPNAEVRAFALVRTMGFVLDVPRLFDPCQGEIQWNGTDAYRAP
jgi:predicted amidophosphoribosyltransferase